MIPAAPPTPDFNIERDIPTLEVQKPLSQSR